MDSKYRLRQEIANARSGRTNGCFETRTYENRSDIKQDVNV